MFRSIHKWFGLSIAAWLVFQSVTGVLLVYRHELQALWAHTNIEDSGSRSSIPIQSVLDNLETDYPARFVERIYFPVVRGEPYLVHFREKERSFSKIVEVNPFTGEMVGASFANRALEWIFDLHHELLLGKVGAYVVGCFGLALLILALSGFWLWWPGFRRLGSAFNVNPRGAGLRSLYDWHRLTGSIVVVIILVSSMTGFMIAYGGQLRSALSISASPVKAVTGDPAKSVLSADKLIAIASSAVPNGGVRDLRFVGPANLLSTIVFFRGGKDRSGPFHRVWIDPYGGNVLGKVNSETLDAGNTFFAWLYPVHTNLGLAQAGKILLAFGGVGILLLSVTGPLFWWRKRVRRTKPVTQARMDLDLQESK